MFTGIMFTRNKELISIVKNNIPNKLPFFVIFIQITYSNILINITISIKIELIYNKIIGLVIIEKDFL